MIIDIHTHLFPKEMEKQHYEKLHLPGFAWDGVYKEATNRYGNEDGKLASVSEVVMVNHLRRAKGGEITRAVVLPLDAPENDSNVNIETDYVLDMAKGFSDAIIPAVSVHPGKDQSYKTLEKMLNKVRKVYEDGRVVVKIHPILQKLYPEKIDDNYLRVLSSYKGLILSHVERGPFSSRDRLGGLLDKIERGKHDIVVVGAHCLPESVKMANERRNFFVDTSAVGIGYADEMLEAQLFADINRRKDNPTEYDGSVTLKEKVLGGTDFPAATWDIQGERKRQMKMLGFDPYANNENILFNI